MVAVIGQYLGNTLVLDSVALILAVALSIAIGMVQGAFAGTCVSKAISVLQFALYAMPIFWLGLILITIFAVQYNLLPSSGSQDISDTSLPSGQLHPAPDPAGDHPDPELRRPLLPLHGRRRPAGVPAGLRDGRHRQGCRAAAHRAAATCCAMRCARW